jgi:hypothetical protein
MILFPFLSSARLEGMWTEVFAMASAIFEWMVTAAHDGIATLRRSFRVVRGAV